MNRQPPSLAAGTNAAPSLAGAASYSSSSSASSAASSGGGGSSNNRKSNKKKRKRLRPQKHISRWSEAFFGGGRGQPRTNSQLQSIDEGLEEEESSSSSSSGATTGGNVSRARASDSHDTVHRSGHSSGDHCGSPRQRGKVGPLHACTGTSARQQHDDAAGNKIAPAPAQTAAAAAAASSTRSLDYASATATVEAGAGASTGSTPYMHNHASNATMPTAASSACYEEDLKDGDWIEPLPPDDEGGTATGTSSRRRLSGGGRHRRSSNSSGSGRSTGAGAAAGDRGGGSGGDRPRLHSIPDDIEVSDDQMLLQQQFQQSALTMRGALSASSGEESSDDNKNIEKRVSAALADGTDQQMVSSRSGSGSGAVSGKGAAADSPASAPRSAVDIALKAYITTSDVPKPAHRSSSFTGSEPIRDANPKTRSSSMPLVGNDDLDIENIMQQAAGASNGAAAGVGVGVGAAQTPSTMSAGLVPPMAGSLMTGRRNDSANSFGGGRCRRASDASNAESIAASSIAAASWMGSMGDSDLSGSSSDCEGDGPNRQRLRTRRRRKKSRRTTRDPRMSNGSDNNGNGPTPMIVVEGASSVQSGRRRTSWTIRPSHLLDSEPAGVAATYRDRRSSDPICRHEVARAIADLEADVSDLDGDSSSDDGNGYEKAPGSRLDAIVASLRAATANGGNNNSNARRNATNQSPRDLHDLFRPNRVLRSTAPREPNSLAPSAAPFHASWPNQASAAMPTLLNNQIAHASASPSVEPTDTSNAAGAASTAAGASIRRQDESFADVEDLIRASLRTQPSSVSLRSQQGGDIHGNERNSQSWPIVSSHRDDIASAAAVGVPVGARRSNNRSDFIIDTLQNLDLRQHLRDHDSASTFNFIDDDEANNDATTTTAAAGSQAGEGSLQTNPLMAERQAILGFGQERLRTGDSGHRISNSVSAVNSGPATSNLSPIETGGPIRGLDALGAAIGAIAAAAPALPPPNVSNSLISHRTSSMSTGTHRSSISSAGGSDEINSAPAVVSSAGTANVSVSSSPPAAAGASTSAPVVNGMTRHSGPTRLYEAVASGSSYDTIKSLIDLDPSSTGHQNGAGLTPLHTAIERYDVPMSIIRLLLASNPSTASMPRTDGRTPMDLLWKRYVDPDSFRIQSSIVAANELATLMEMAVSDDGCNRPPSNQSGSDEEVDLEESSSRPGGLSKRDMDRKARAMRILLSSPRLRDYWDLMTLFVRAAHHGTIADPLPSEHGRWRIVHSCVVTRCEPLMIRFAAALYPEQLRERDEQSGRIPLHITSALSCERSANSIDKTVLRLWPRGAWLHDNEGRLAINLAIEAGKPWRFVRALLLCAPPSLLTRDTKTRMMPFMIAASSPDASLDCSYRLLRDSVDVITSALASSRKVSSRSSFDYGDDGDGK